MDQDALAEIARGYMLHAFGEAGKVAGFARNERAICLSVERANSSGVTVVLVDQTIEWPGGSEQDAHAWAAKAVETLKAANPSLVVPQTEP